MKMNRNSISVIFALIIILSIGISVGSSSESTVISYSIDLSDTAIVMNVPYVWQELNGFCHWAAYSMILQSAGVPLDLYGVFAASGIGFSSSYLRLDTNMMLLPGVFFPQMVSTFAVEEIYDVNVTMYLDGTTVTNAEIVASNLESRGIEFTKVTGFDEALEILKDTIDSGYPIEVWTDPYYLPPWDYDILRDLGIQYDSSGSAGHAIVAVGYNETAGIVHILDPGVGAFGDVAYPDDGRYYYDLNMTQLDHAWRPLFYGCITAKPGEGLPADSDTRLTDHILGRMRGERSYLFSMEDAFFWVLGSNAFRGLSYDLTATGLSSYLEEFGTLTLSQKAQVIQGLGFFIEGSLALQHLSFLGAVQALPEMLPEFDLDEFVTACSVAIPHFEAISDDASLINIAYAGGASVTTNTFNRIAYDCQFTYGGDVQSAVTDSEEDLDTLRNHLLAIADAWDVAADALDRAVNGDVTALILGIVGTASFVSVVSVIVYRRRRV